VTKDEVQCTVCSARINGQVCSAGLSDLVPFTCDRDSTVLTVSIYDKTIDSLLGGRPNSPWTRDHFRTIENYLITCPCGGKFQHDVMPKCPNCGAVLSPPKGHSEFMVVGREIDGEIESPWRHRSIPGTYARETELRWKLAAEPLLIRLGYRILMARHRHSGEVERPILHSTHELDEYLWRFADYLTEKHGSSYLIIVKTQPYFMTQSQGQINRFGSDAPLEFAEKEFEAYRNPKITVLILLIQYRADDKSSGLDPLYFGLVPFQELQPKPGWRGLTLPRHPDAILATLEEGEATRLLSKVQQHDIDTLTFQV
jgi:hypothetical protein